MPSLTPTDATQRVLENVGRVVGDAQCPAAAIQRKLDDSYRTLRRRLSEEFPTIYEKVSSPITVAAGAVSFNKPTDCEAIRVLEKQSAYNSSCWYPVDVAPSLNRDQYGTLSFYEMGAVLYLSPFPAAPGTYRLYYIASPPDTITTYDVPNGLERILIEEASAWARQRHNEMEQVAYHLAQARQIWDDNYMGLWRRYGSHGQSGLQEARGY